MKPYFLGKISKNNHSAGFTLIEMMVSLVLFSIIIIIAFSALTNIGVLRTQVSSAFDLNTELYNATEKFIGLIKNGGDIDYEEYWNRQAVGVATSSGHYRDFSGFGNYGIGGAGFGNELYYCSNIGNTGGCLSPGKQRYGEYRQQFIDYNSDGGADAGVDDDEDLGNGPKAFDSGTAMKELYLVKKGTKAERTYFRWIVRPDPNAPSSATCSISGPSMGSGCLGNIQILKLIGRDLGMSHSGGINSTGRYDGVIDTWECHKDFNCPTENLPVGLDSEWVNIFPDFINVKSIDFYPYPEKDFRYSWKDANDGVITNGYVRMKLTLGLAWEKRKKIKGPAPDTTITTTINLEK